MSINKMEKEDDYLSKLIHIISFVNDCLVESSTAAYYKHLVSVINTSRYQYNLLCLIVVLNIFQNGLHLSFFYCNSILQRKSPVPICLLITDAFYDFLCHPSVESVVLQHQINFSNPINSLGDAAVIRFVLIDHGLSISTTPGDNQKKLSII